MEATARWLQPLFLAAPEVEMKSDPIGRCLAEMQSTNAPNPYSGTFAWAQAISSGDLQGDSEAEEETMARLSSRCEACSRNISRDRVNWQRARGKNISKVDAIGLLRRTGSVAPLSSMSNEHPAAMMLAFVRAVVYMRPHA